MCGRSLSEPRPNPYCRSIWEPCCDRLGAVAGQEQSAWIGAVAIGVVLFASAVLSIRAGGGWAALGWVLMVIVVLGAVGAVGSRFTRR